MKEEISYRYNIMNIYTTGSFGSVKGGFHSGCRDVYFVRFQGTYEGLLKDIKKLDEQMEEYMSVGQVIYRRINQLPNLSSMEAAEYFSDVYNNWIAKDRKEIILEGTKSNLNLQLRLGDACNKAIFYYQKSKNNITDSMIKNFTIKILYWFNELFGNSLEKWTKRTNIKVVCSNVTREQEYLFYYMLTLIGVDVLLMQCRNDLKLSEELLQLSISQKVGEYGDLDIQNFEKKSDQKHENKDSSKITENDTNRNIQMSIPPRMLNTSVNTDETKSKITNQTRSNASNIQVTPSNSGKMRVTEKSFEEIALLASSIVMIAIHDSKGDIIGSGSGIMIGREGYILTNNHVASGGRFYSVRIEDDDEIYKTDEVIKYNSVLDLAIIRIDRKLKPMSIYKGKEKLVRGQKVVAIGSPLGLFNSVSDGIISGFRVINKVDMIQFTAPISHGSSGGAVLNIYGEVIGISTAGIDSGQNINLAMGYECVNMFIKGFVS